MSAKERDINQEIQDLIDQFCKTLHITNCPEFYGFMSISPESIEQVMDSMELQLMGIKP